MIIYRYLSKEIFFSTFSVALVLVPIIVSGRLISLLSFATPGEMSARFILEMIGYRLPSMLMLILPLALFLGVLLSLGRMYLDSEMAVLRASGVSSKRMVIFALGPAVGGALIIGSISLYISPLAWQALEVSYAQQDSLNELDKLTEGRFQKLPGGRTAYTSSFSENRSKLDQVFIAQVDQRTGKLEITFAQSGKQQINSDSKRYLVLENGHRYKGNPGEAEYEKLTYSEYGYLLPESKIQSSSDEPYAKSTRFLLQSDNPVYIAELQWRISLPLLAVIVVMIAVPLSRTSPRQGRFARLIPSIILYLVYITLLTTARDKVEDGSSILMIWFVHALFFGYGLSLIFMEDFWGRLFNKLPSLPSLRKGSAK